MTSRGDPVEIAQGLLRTLIATSPEYNRGELTRADIQRHAGVALSAAEQTGGAAAGLTSEALAGWAEMQFNVRQPEAARLIGDEADHVAWVSARRSDLFPLTGFWSHYRQLLETRLPPRPLNRLDLVTDQILDELEDPGRAGQWDRRGLVMGHVQSGKTNNYLGLVAKAADSGYRLIVVLAGLHNNLRAQTQHRVDEGVIGRDTRDGERSIRRFGVGLMQSHPAVLTMTSASDQGDFKRVVADNVGNPFADIAHPTLFVVKKHVSILENLYEWLRENANQPEGNERIADVPLLLIDDEADNASIDTAEHDRDEETDPTRTNYGIRRILNLFDQSAYVGYTATPFANVFIDDRGRHPEVGDDLFPRDFIFSLEAPSNYVGPKRVFGLAHPDGSDLPTEEYGLPILNRVTDAEDWMPLRHASDYRPPESVLPNSLKRAVSSFVLAGAARASRGQHSAHNSMLVHVTRFTTPQNEVRQQVEDLVLDMRNEILYGGDPSTFENLEAVWKNDFVPAARALEGEDSAPRVQDFAEIRPYLDAAVSAIQVRAINGTSADVLDYKDHEPLGLSVIVIGGAKLSRGLTLEGLTVSYYLRSTRMYDTLMQMGRWFGYRHGYLDLCRVYTNPDVISWYRNIALATEELLADFRAMQEANGRPKDFGLRVRHSPGMMITSNVKMRHGVRRSVNFGERRPEVTSFEIVPDRRTKAMARFEGLIDSLFALAPIEEKGTSGDTSWRGVPGQVVLNYLQGLSEDGLYPFASSARPGYLADYLRRRMEKGGLVDWTVLVKSNSLAERDAIYHCADGRLKIGMSRRTDRAGTDHYAVKSLIGSADEKFDLSEEQLANARIAANKNVPSGLYVRRVRPHTNGLLILYLLDPVGIRTQLENGEKVAASHIPPGDPFAAFCLSLPKDPDNTLIEYTVNNVYERSAGAASA